MNNFIPSKFIFALNKLHSHFHWNILQATKIFKLFISYCSSSTFYFFLCSRLTKTRSIPVLYKNAHSFFLETVSRMEWGSFPQHLFTRRIYSSLLTKETGQKQLISIPSPLKRKPALDSPNMSHPLLLFFCPFTVSHHILNLP